MPLPRWLSYEAEFSAPRAANEGKQSLSLLPCSPFCPGQMDWLPVKMKCRTLEVK